MTAVAARVVAQAQRMRDGLEAGMLAGELGCQVTPHPELAGRVEAWEPLPGWHLLIGTPEEVRRAVAAERRRRALLVWLKVLGSQGQP
jgi:hypothetical protein